MLVPSSFRAASTSALPDSASLETLFFDWAKADMNKSESEAGVGGELATPSLVRRVMYDRAQAGRVAWLAEVEASTSKNSCKYPWE